jgi:hypothetical protein
MRQVKATILLILFIATFGRCFAEQYGVLGDTDLACCVEHNECCEGEESADHEDEETPECPVCVLIDSSALVGNSPGELAPPVYSLASTFFAVDAWSPGIPDLLLERCDSGEERIPSPPPRLSVSLRELVLYSAPVRGPTRG